MSSNTITLKGHGRYDEAVAQAAITPGHFIEMLSTGKVQKQSTEGATGVLRIAREDALQGKTITDAYAANDVVGFILPEKGDVVNAMLQAGVSYAKGDKLHLGGDGTLIKTSALSTTALNEDPVAEVEEALDLSASGAVDAHSAVVIL